MHKTKTRKSFSFVGWLICLIGAAFYCYEYLLRIEPSIMVSQIMKQLNISATGFGLITVAFYFAYTPMQLFVGVLIDRYGSKLMLGIGIIACTVGSLLFNFFASIYLTAIARFLIGFGSAFAFVGVLKLGAEWLPKRHFAFFAGLTTALGMLGAMFGQITLTSLMNTISWKHVLHLGTIIGIILIPIMLLFIHDSPKSKNAPTRSKTTFKKTLTGLKKIFKNPQMWLCGFIANTLFLSLSAFAELWGIKFLQVVYNIQTEQASIACSMVFLGWLIGGPFNGWLSDHINSRKIPLIAGGLSSAVIISIIILHPFDISFSVLCFFLFLFGIFSSTEILCFAISREINCHTVTATALAFTNFLVMIGGVVFQPLIGALLDLIWDGKMVNNIRVYSPSNYQTIFMLIPIFIVIGSLLTFKLKETLKKKITNE